MSTDKSLEEYASLYISDVVSTSITKIKDKMKVEEDVKRDLTPHNLDGQMIEMVNSEDDDRPTESESDSDLLIYDKMESHFFNNDEEETNINSVPADPENETAAEERVLIEKDGKFELVDVNEVKAQYFEMIGVRLPSKGPKTEAEEKPATDRDTDIHKIDLKTNKLDLNPAESIKYRPKTSPIRLPHIKPQVSTRATSALINTRNPEYDHIKSRYAMTGQQLEMKRRREERIALRKKEEKERGEEEEQRRQQEAERAFQSWLQAKRSEATEQRRKAMENRNTDDVATEKAKAAESAYKSWLVDKSKQIKQERKVEKYKLAEDAASYVIRDRALCDEAFDRWMRKKRSEAKQRSIIKIPRRSRGRKRVSVKEGPPLNGPAIRFTDYYGYRNTVAL